MLIFKIQKITTGLVKSKHEISVNIVFCSSIASSKAKASL
jgi:hypothetical protein